MSVEASGKNMEAVCKAKEVHDRTCPWGGKATEVHLAYFDIERIGWEEGDLICGLVVVGDAKSPPGMMRVTCDAEPDDGPAGRGRGRGGRRRRRRPRAGDHRARHPDRAWSWTARLLDT